MFPKILVVLTVSAMFVIPVTTVGSAIYPRPMWSNEDLQKNKHFLSFMYFGWVMLGVFAWLFSLVLSVEMPVYFLVVGSVLSALSLRWNGRFYWFFSGVAVGLSTFPIANSFPYTEVWWAVVPLVPAALFYHLSENATNKRIARLSQAAMFFCLTITGGLLVRTFA